MVRPPKAEHALLAEGLRVLSRATRAVFARVYQKREDEARVKRDVCAVFGLLSRHYSGCRAGAAAAANGWRERLIEQRAHLRRRLAALEATRGRDAKSFMRRRRNAVATRKAQTRLARVERELLGPSRHCFGGRKLLRQGRIAAWRARRDGNALFAGETGKVGGNGVARWDFETGRLVVKLPGGLPPVVLGGVRFSDKVVEDLRACMEARTPVSWRVKLLSRGRVELCVTYDEPVPALCTDAARGALALDLNAGHVAATLVGGGGRLLGARRHDLPADRDGLQGVVRRLSVMAARLGVPVVAEDLDFRTKKAWLKRYGKALAQVLSLFRSRQFMRVLERQCARRGVEVVAVDPAWTTKLAKSERYPGRYRLSIHHAAALVIGRRGLGFAERVSTPAASLVRAGVKRRGTRGWTSVLSQWLPRAWRRGGRRGAQRRPGAREGPAGETMSVRPRLDGAPGAASSRGAVGPARAAVFTVA